MGLGVMGSDFVGKLAPLGFRVLGYSRTPSALPGIVSFHGEGRFRPFLEQSEILVNFLPLTEQTRRILNAERLAWLPRGACIINLARGGHVDEAALLAALDAGRLRAAGLDVFATEPLPLDSPLRGHPKVTALPHIGSATHETRYAMAALATTNLLQALAGETPAAVFR